MSWVRIDDGYSHHPKLLQAGLEARGLDIAGICYASKYETDGFIPDSALTLLANGCRAPQKVAQRLVDAKRWDRDDKANGYWIHDFLDFNFSSSQQQQRRKTRAEAGAVGGRRSGESRRSNDEAKPKQMLQQNRSKRSSKTEAKTNPDPNPRDIHKSSSESELTTPAREAAEDDFFEHSAPDDEKSQVKAISEDESGVENLVNQAIRAVAEHRGSTANIRSNRNAWLGKTADSIRKTHYHPLRFQAVLHPDWTPERIANEVGLIGKPGANSSQTDALSTTQRAGNAQFAEGNKALEEQVQTDAEWKQNRELARNFASQGRAMLGIDDEARDEGRESA